MTEATSPQATRPAPEKGIVADADRDVRPVVNDIAAVLDARHWSLAVAESLTGGLLSSHFAAAPGAGTWYCGGIVAYTREVKHTLLGAGNGRLVSKQTACQMARGAADLFCSDVAVAVTGAGGPSGLDGAEPGQVWIAVHIHGDTISRGHSFGGGPAAVCEQTCSAAIQLTGEALGAIPSS
jgi:nicotinamide-nucleotide amidase